MKNLIEILLPLWAYFSLPLAIGCFLAAVLLLIFSKFSGAVTMMALAIIIATSHVYLIIKLEDIRDWLEGD